MVRVADQGNVSWPVPDGKIGAHVTQLGNVYVCYANGNLRRSVQAALDGLRHPS